MSTEDESGASHEHRHGLPAVEDWPRGFGEASWWPFVTAIGAAGIYVAAGLFVLGHRESPVVDPAVGPWAFVATTALFLTGLYGWVYHAFVSDFWSRGSDGSTGKFRWGMTLFLGSEVATFGAGFVYYAFVRVGQWPPAHLPDVLSSLVLANTAVLVLSSVTLHFAHVSLREGRRRRFMGLFSLTVLLGLAFVAGQAWEYYQFVVREGFTLTQGVYASAFFGLTGLHGLHVSLGVALLLTLLVRAAYGQYSPERHTSITTVSMYWHFVDAVWILLVVTLYVGATV
ncbi:MAG: cytochrome c oxidase subunit 3 [Haloferacaceae archaeon]